jgi:hypothetical protein
MKPQFQFSPTARLNQSEKLRFPATDYNYLGASGDFRGHASAAKPAVPQPTAGFRDLSNDFIGAEMKRDYVAEAAFFAIIVAVSAWPIVSMIRAMADLLK